jgi:hypothetical protein
VTEDELEAAFLELVEKRGFDRILGLLRTQWERVPRETILNVVHDAATEVVRRHRDGQVVTNVPGLVTTIARRTLSKVWATMQEAEEAEAAVELQTKYPEVWQHDEERVVQVKRAAAFVRTLVPKLDNENHRRTIYAILDAAEEGRQLQNKDLAEQLGCAADTAGKWKERAPERLLPILREAGFETLDDLLARAELSYDTEYDDTEFIHDYDQDNLDEESSYE